MGVSVNQGSHPTPENHSGGETATNNGRFSPLIARSIRGNGIFNRVPDEGVHLFIGAKIMGITSWRGQIERALQAIDHIGESKYAAKQEQGWQPGEAVVGLFSHGYRNTVFDRAVTFTNWLREQYPTVRLFREVDHEMTAEFLGEKAETCTPDTVRTLLATLKKLQEGLYVMNWIQEDIVPTE